MIAELLDATGRLRIVDVRGTATTRADGPVITIDGDLHIVIDLKREDD